MKRLANILRRLADKLDPPVKYGVGTGEMLDVKEGNVTVEAGPDMPYPKKKK